MYNGIQNMNTKNSANSPALIACQMLQNMSTSTGKYFMTSLAFSSLNHKDAMKVFNNAIQPNNYTPTQQVMSNSLQDIDYRVNQIDKVRINQYLRRPDVNNQLRNHTLLNNLSRTNLPKQYRRLLIKIPHLTSAQILHKFYIQNIVKQHHNYNLTELQHQKYQHLLNQGVQLGTKISPVGLNYFQQLIKTYQEYPALRYAMQTKDTSQLTNTDLDAYQHIQDIQQGTITQGNHVSKIQAPVNSIEELRISQYVNKLPTQLIQSNDLLNLLRNVSGKSITYQSTSQTRQFIKNYTIMSPQEQRGYKYLIQQSDHDYKNIQSVLQDNINNPIEKQEHNHLNNLLSGYDERGNQVNSPVEPQQRQRMEQFFTNPDNQKLLQNGTYANALYNYDYGNTSINGIVNKAMKGKALTLQQANLNLNKISQRYKSLDLQSQRYMKAIVNRYEYNPQSFERQYIANLSGNPHMLLALSHSEKRSWQHIQDIAKGKNVISGRIIRTGNTAQHKLDVDYIISQPINRSMLRNGSLKQILDKDSDIQALASVNQQKINNLANTVKEPHSTFGTLHTKKYIKKLIASPQQHKDISSSQQVSHQRHTKQR